MSLGISGYGVYIPRYRIKTTDISKVWGGGVPRVEEKSVVGLDEDAFTMATESSLNALDMAGIGSDQLDAVYVASQSFPFSDKTTSSTLAAAIGCKKEVFTATFADSSNAGTTALISALDFLNAGKGKKVLVTVADCQQSDPGSIAERTLGAGAASFIISSENLIASIEATNSIRGDIGDELVKEDNRIRESGFERFAKGYGYSGHINSTTKGLMKKIGSINMDHVIFQQPDGAVPMSTARKLGFQDNQVAQGFLVKKIGDAGAASCLLGLASVLDVAKSKENILVVSYGFGVGSDAIYLAMGDQSHEPEKYRTVKKYIERNEPIDYLTFSKYTGLVSVRGAGINNPMNLSVIRSWREMPFKYGLVGMKCKNCGAINYPRRKVCRNCKARLFESNKDFEYVKLPRTGTIYSYSIINFAPEGFDDKAPYPLAIIDMGEDLKILSRLTDWKQEDLKIGTQVEMVIRRISKTNDMLDYGINFRPVF
jgi:hydroxymethylglutaryl-CoA synthase